MSEPRSSPDPLDVPYPARAWAGDRLLAESAAAVRCDQPGQAPTLWFPEALAIKGLLSFDEKRVTSTAELPELR